MEHFIFDRERIPWEKLLRDAQAGDKSAMERFCFWRHGTFLFLCGTHHTDLFPDSCAGTPAGPG